MILTFVCLICFTKQEENGQMVRGGKGSREGKRKERKSKKRKGKMETKFCKWEEET